MYDHKIREYLDLKKTPGEFGVEIEMEVNRELHSDYIPNVWRLEKDNSLRGYSGELVLNQPLSIGNLAHELVLLRERLANNGVKIKDSVRASVHVHMNMQERTIGEVFKFLMCYYPLETVLMKFCGDKRNGNLFCLRMQDAEATSYLINQALNKDDLYFLRTNSLRYSAMNFQSLFSYGSVEARGLPTTPTLDNIVVWCEMLKRLKEHSLSVKSCWDNIAEISGLGPKEWARKIMGADLFKHLEYEGMEGDIMNDARNIQHTCHILSNKGL